MTSDPLFYRLFATSPETLFELLGMPADEARELASRYQFQAIEFKETALRSDGVFIPKESGGRLYFVEAQFYRSPAVYVDLLAKVFTYLKKNDPAQSFRGIVLFETRILAPKEIEPCEPMLEKQYILPFFLDELPETANAPLGLSILRLIGQSQSQAQAQARGLVVRARTEIADEPLKNTLLELIETALFYKLKNLTREEVQAMLQIGDFTDSRLYKSIKEEGREEGKEEGREEGFAQCLTILRLTAAGKTAEEISAELKVKVEKVRMVLANVGDNA